MIRNMEYLSDSELENLISELEQSDLVSAPPNLRLDIIEKLDREIQEQEQRKAQEKVIAFKRYRLRVLTTVAAAVFVVLLLPKFDSLQLPEVDLVKPLPKQEYSIQGRYASKEEALNDSSMLENLLGGVNIFSDNNRYHLFRE